MDVAKIKGFHESWGNLHANGNAPAMRDSGQGPSPRKVAVDNFGPASDASASAASPLGSYDQVSKPGKTAKQIDMPIERDTLSFVTNLLDKSLQVQICGMPTTHDELLPTIGAFAGQLDKVRRKFSEHFPEDLKGGFGPMLDAILTIAQCSIGGVDQGPLPSAVRVARQVVHLGGKTSDGHVWKSAFAMLNHAAGQVLMEGSRITATTGLQDQAADTQFESLAAGLEAEMAAAYEDGIVEWAECSVDGGPLLMADFATFAKLARRTATEMMMVGGQWSKARTEQRCCEIADVTVGLLSIAHAGVWIGAQAFCRELPELSAAISGGGRSVPTDDVLAQAADGNDVSDVAAYMCQLSLPKADALSSLCGGAADSDANGLAPSANPHFDHLQAAIVEFKLALEGYLDELSNIVADVSRMVNFFEEKVGDQFKTSLGFSDAAAYALGVSTQRNKDALNQMAAYIHDTTALAQTPAADFSARSPAENDKYLKTLASFCAVHRKITSASDVYTLDLGLFHKVQDLVTTPALIREFAANAGESTFSEHVNTSLSSVVRGITAHSVSIMTVQSSTIQKSQEGLLRIFDILVDCNDIASLGNLPTDAEMSSSSAALTTENWPHNVMLRNLMSLVEALEVGNIECLGIRCVRSGDIVPAERAITFLTLLARVRDVAAFAAVFVRLMDTSDEQKSADRMVLAGELPQVCCSMGNALTSLDSFLSSAEATKMEEEAFRMTPTFEAARGWRHNMALLRSKGLDALLAAWSRDLESASGVAIAVCPSWGAAFSDSGYDESMAMSLVRGRLPRTIEAHNTLHTILGQYAAAATLLDLSPRLQVNPMTKSSIAVAMRSLARVKDTATFIRGVELHAGVKHLAHGPRDVADYLRGHPPNTRGEVLGSYWLFMEAFAADANVPKSTAAAPGRKVPEEANHKGVKRELADLQGQETTAGSSSSSVKGSRPDDDGSSMQSPAMRLKRRRA